MLGRHCFQRLLRMVAATAASADVIALEKRALRARSLFSGSITGLAGFLPKMRDSNVAILDSPLQCGALGVRSPDRHAVTRQTIAPDVDSDR